MAIDTIPRDRRHHATELLAQVASLLATVELELEDPREDENAYLRQANVCRTARDMVHEVLGAIDVPTTGGDKPNRDAITESGNSRNDVELRENDHWPIVWRVVAPACGSYDTDMVFIETTDGDAAMKKFRSCRRSRLPVRIERVSCGPLPKGAMELLIEIRNSNRQNPGTSLRSIEAAWSR